MTTDQKLKKQEQIAAMIAKATDPASSPSESRSAMMMADKLMGRYGITQKDLDSAKQDAFKFEDVAMRKSKKGKPLIHPVDRYLGAVIGNYCGCKVYMALGLTKGSVKYFGFIEDVDFAKQIIDRLKEHFDASWELYRQDGILARDMRSARMTFSLAFAASFSERLEGWETNNQAKKHEQPTKEQAKEDRERYALVAKRSDRVIGELADRGIKFTTHADSGSLRYKIDPKAAGAGTMAGKSMTMGTGVGKSAFTKAIGKE